MLHQSQEVYLLRSLDYLLLLLGDNEHNYYSSSSLPPTTIIAHTKSSHRRGRGRRKGKGASLTMVRPSTQQTVDRIVGTAAILGLSVVFVRWLSSRNSTSISSPSPSCESKTKDVDEKRRYRYAAWSTIPWWWPVIAVKSWNKRRNRKNNEKEGDNGLKDGRQKDDKNIIESNDADGEKHLYEHYGSCHCGSIYFVLRGSRRLRAIDSPGKIRYPHVSTSASKFELLRGEHNMRFYYEDNTNNDDSSSITFDNVANNGEMAESRNTNDNIVLEDDANESNNKEEQLASGAHVFCGNCGVHVFHADRSTGALEVNANCLDDDGLLLEDTKLAYREQSSSGLSSVTNTGQLQAKSSTIETVSENEPFLGGGGGSGAAPPQQQQQHQRFLMESLESNGNDVDNDNHQSSFNYNYKHNSTIPPRKESISSTQSESYNSTAMMGTESVDDLSMGSSSITGGGGMPLYHHSSLSVASSTAAGGAGGDSRMGRTGLPPLGPSSSGTSRIPLPSSDRSVKTLPPRFGGYPPSSSGSGGSVHRAGTVVSSSGWSVASMESNDLDGVGDGGGNRISPRMRDQMKKYMGRHMSSSEKGK